MLLPPCCTSLRAHPAIETQYWSDLCVTGSHCSTTIETATKTRKDPQARFFLCAHLGQVVQWKCVNHSLSCHCRDNIATCSIDLHGCFRWLVGEITSSCEAAFGETCSHMAQKADMSVRETSLICVADTQITMVTRQQLTYSNLQWLC